MFTLLLKMLIYKMCLLGPGFFFRRFCDHSTEFGCVSVVHVRQDVYEHVLMYF